MKYLSVLALIICVIKLNQCLPYDSSVISKYSKVALWGKNNTGSSEARDTSGNTWNHRSDPKSIAMNVKSTPSVAYQYPVYHKPEEKIDQHIEHVDGIGEVIVKHAQDRFEARPLFAYKNKLAASYGPPPASKLTGAAAPAPAPPPVTESPSLEAPAISNPYNSPYTSYNPPKFEQDNSDISNLYSPNLPSKGDSMNSPASGDAIMDVSPSTETVKSIPDSYASLGPPLAPNKPEKHIHYSNHEYHDHDSYGQRDYQDHHPSHDSMAMYKYNNEAPDHPPKSLDDVYYPSDFPKDQIPGQGMMDHDMDQDMVPDAQHDMDESHDAPMMPQGDQILMPQGNQVMKPDVMDEGKSNDDMPYHDYGDYKFPKYLYDHDHNHDHHHVYEEIPHTTMAPAKEDKRVSSTNYSYYYLGRKLWYIPLYFSIYFIIYVTVLILKSIARHKVRLKYKWYDRDPSAKQARSMDLSNARIEETTNLHHNVLTAIQNVTDKYKDLAM